MTTKRLLALVITVLVIFGIFAMCTANEADAQSQNVYTAWDLDDSPVLTSQIEQAVLDAIAPHPEITAVYLMSGTLRPNIYAELADSNTVAFNDLWMSEPERLGASWAEGIADGRHTPFGRCSVAQVLAYHEAAHLIDQAHGLAPRKLVAQRLAGINLTGALPSYGLKPDGTIIAHEALAEAYAAVKCNGGNELEQRLAQILEA